MSAAYAAVSFEKYRHDLQFRFPPPPLVLESTRDHIWPVLTRTKRGETGLFRIGLDGQQGTGGYKKGPDSDVSGDVSAGP
jgi:hypothetical protein